MLAVVRSIAVVSLCTLALTCNSAQAQFQLEEAFPSLSFSLPVDLQHAGDGSGRLFVVEQEGIIQVFENRADVAASEVFLDITDRVQCCGEKGLLGLAFHPDFEQNGVFFVDYTAPDPLRTVIARYRLDPADPSRADPGSEEILLEVEQPYGNHNAGQIAFGPDGMLYVTLGDGGSGGDPDENGQDRTTLLGSILRIDVDNVPEGERYGIPADNPFAGNTSGFREEIYAYGLRNPWRIAFDAESGRLWTGDVGQNAWEEVDVIEAGGNYGWNVREGEHCFEPRTGCDESGLTEPVWEYDHDAGQSITGGYVYRGSRLPELAGRYIYGDYLSGRIWALAYDAASGSVENEELLKSRLRLSSFGADQEGELYLLDYQEDNEGRVYRFVATVGTSAETEETPEPDAELGQNYPDPFRGTTAIPYRLTTPSAVDLAIYDLLGRRVRTLVARWHEAGDHVARWNGLDATGTSLSGGLYFYRLLVGDRLLPAHAMVLAP